jgi:hypothetical protein
MQRVLIEPALWDLREQEPGEIEAELRGPQGTRMAGSLVCRRERTTMDFVSSSATESARTTEKSAPGNAMTLGSNYCLARPSDRC